MRGFDFARKMKDGKPVMELDERNVMGEVKAFKDAQIPEYQTRGSAGADFFCAEAVVVPSIWRSLVGRLSPRISNDRINMSTDGDSDTIKKLFQPTLVHTGIKASMYDDEVLEIYNRSSNPKKLGLILANSVGIIDADYYNNQDNDGEIMFAFYNIMPWDTSIKVGDRIGQGVFKKCLRPESGLRVKDEDRVGGIGSTNSTIKE